MFEDLGSADGTPHSALGQAVFRLRFHSGVEEPIGADLYRYEVTIEEGGTSQMITIQDDDPPRSPVLRELLTLVRS